MSDMSIVEKSLNKAINGGLSGATAMVIQVTSLMWLRTTMNNQYRYGGSTIDTIKKLYNSGGLIRFYRGYIPALCIGPLSRFGDVASNELSIKALDNSNLSTSTKTFIGSSFAATWRAFLMPIDAIKTTLQVEGKHGISLLKNKLNKSGPKVLYHGTLASMSATFVGHYPWFLTYNLLDENIPKYNENYKIYLRNGFIGFNSAVVSDCCSNSF